MCDHVAVLALAAVYVNSLNTGSRERAPSPNFPQLYIVGPSSGFNKGLGSASFGIRAPVSSIHFLGH